MIIKNPREFLERVRVAVSKLRFNTWSGLVSYFDPEVGIERLEREIDVVFNKRDEFDYQREYRIAFDTGTKDCNPVTLNIGKIDDIAFAVRAADIELQIAVKQPIDDASGRWHGDN